MEESRPLRIWTVGHSIRREEDFMGLLRAHGIRYAADVRRFPGSRRNPAFSRDRLEKVLIEAGIVYLALGRGLGGLRREGFDAWMGTEAFQAGMAELLDAAGRGPTAIFCAEALPSRCHRRYLADALAGLGHEVVHILGESRELVHTPGCLRGPQRELAF